MVSVSITTSLDVGAIEGRLHADEAAILRRHQSEIIAAIKARWTGWKYVGRPPASVGRSRAAWKGRVQATRVPYELVIGNAARSYYGGKPYAAFVARSAGDEEEWRVVHRWLLAERLPLLKADLADAIRKNIGTSRPMKPLRASGGGGRKSVTLT